MNREHAQIIILSVDVELKQRIEKFNLKTSVEISSLKSLDQIGHQMQTESYDIFILTSTACQNQLDHCLARLQEIISKNPSTQILFFVEPEDIEVGIRSLQQGVYQYAKIPVSNEELQLLIETALERKPFINVTSPDEIKPVQNRLGKLVGASEKMRKVYRQIHQAASSEVNILLLGETGTGKDLAAQMIHQLSNRKDGPYLPINLGALPSDLVASELFGHEKGAFTGSIKQTLGLFEKGINGIIFLDEIEAIDEKVQISLLRLIEHKEFHRLGGKKAIKTNVRLIAASNENLKKLVDRGVFRKDLYYRLDVFRIVMPPLRENLEDIPILINEFIARYNRSFKKNITHIDPEAVQLLQAYEWPGNARELKNVIQRAAIVCECNKILPEHLPKRFRGHEPQKPTVTFQVGTPLEQVEKEMIRRALALANNNRTHAAELLGISRRAIYNKLRKHNLG